MQAKGIVAILIATHGAAECPEHGPYRPQDSIDHDDYEWRHHQHHQQWDGENAIRQGVY